MFLDALVLPSFTHDFKFITKKIELTSDKLFWFPIINDIKAGLLWLIIYI